MADDAHEERLRQHEDILRSLTAMLAAQHVMNERQVAINHEIQRTLDRLEITQARIETLNRTEPSVLLGRAEPSPLVQHSRQTTTSTESLLEPDDGASTLLRQPAKRTTRARLDADDLEDMPLEPETASATLLRQPANEPSGREAAPVATADTPGADTPVARRRARVLAAVPWEADTPGGVSPADIRRATGLSPTEVANDLRDLGKRGQVLKVDAGQYVRRETVPH